MKHLKWTAIPVAALGLVFAFFGILWIALPQLAAGAALLTIAVGVWRTTTGAWPLGVRNTA